MEKQNKNISVSHIVATVLICFTLIGLAVYGVYYNIKAERAERALENNTTIRLLIWRIMSAPLNIIY